MRRRLALPAAAALACGTLAASATGAHRHPALPTSLDGCVKAGKSATIVRFPVGRGEHGEHVLGAALGRGGTGVALSNESDRDLCSWLPFARTLAAQGFRVLLYDSLARPAEDEAAAAAVELKRLGAVRIVLMGASEGAKASIVAAARRPGLVTAVVALSPERYLAGEDVTRSARRLTVPALFAVADDDPYSARDTPALERAAGSARKRLVTVPGDAHGVALLHGPPAATVAAAVYGFLSPLGPPRTMPTLAAECGASVAASVPGVRPVAFTAGDGVRLHGETFGSGDTAVVLAHEYPASLCGWFPYATELARAGLRVLAFDSRDTGTRLDLDVVAAVEEARALGSTRVVAMGASLGGAATLVAAGRDCFDVSGLVSASGETDLRGVPGVPPLYAAPEERHIAAPLLVVGSKEDPLVDEAAVDRLLARAASPRKRSVLVAGAGHGWDLLQGAGRNARVRSAVLRFLRSAGPPVATGC